MFARGTSGRAPQAHRRGAEWLRLVIRRGWADQLRDRQYNVTNGFPERLRFARQQDGRPYIGTPYPAALIFQKGRPAPKRPAARISRQPPTTKLYPPAQTWRITIGVAEVASGASNLSEARRGARIPFSFPARIRASE
jgi:hypothetical protein